MTAKRNIVVYKIIRPVGNYYETPYQYIKIEIPSCLETKLEKPKMGPTYGIGDLIIEKGFHSCKFVKDLIQLSREYDWVKECILVKCIIPKGAQYYIGFDDSKRVSYASDKLNYIEILNINLK